MYFELVDVFAILWVPFAILRLFQLLACHTHSKLVIRHFKSPKIINISMWVKRGIVLVFLLKMVVDFIYSFFTRSYNPWLFYLWMWSLFFLILSYAVDHVYCSFFNPGLLNVFLPRRPYLQALYTYLSGLLFLSFACFCWFGDCRLWIIDYLMSNQVEIKLMVGWTYFLLDGHLRDSVAWSSNRPFISHHNMFFNFFFRILALVIVLVKYK